VLSGKHVHRSICDMHGIVVQLCCAGCGAGEAALLCVDGVGGFRAAHAVPERLYRWPIQVHKSCVLMELGVIRLLEPDPSDPCPHQICFVAST
jgi:hypothetical protein